MGGRGVANPIASVHRVLVTNACQIAAGGTDGGKLQIRGWPLVRGEFILRQSAGDANIHHMDAKFKVALNFLHHQNILGHCWTFFAI
jgi:hypothetical protein